MPAYNSQLTASSADRVKIVIKTLHPLSVLLYFSDFRQQKKIVRKLAGVP